MHKRGLCRHAVSVCPSVTFVSCVETNKHIFEIFHHRVATPFCAKRHGDIPMGNPPNGGVESGIFLDLLGGIDPPNQKGVPLLTEL